MALRANQALNTKTVRFPTLIQAVRALIQINEAHYEQADFRECSLDQR